MTPGDISKRVVADRLEWVDRMLSEIRSLPLDDRDAFFADSRNLWTAESCLRRALEALFDLGRHILAKGFSVGASEYKEIALKLKVQKVISDRDADLFSILAGYRNRLVHFYHEVEADELYRICVHQLPDVEYFADLFRGWLKKHPERLDEEL